MSINNIWIFFFIYPTPHVFVVVLILFRFYWIDKITNDPRSKATIKQLRDKNPSIFNETNEEPNCRFLCRLHTFTKEWLGVFRKYHIRNINRTKINKMWLQIHTKTKKKYAKKKAKQNFHFCSTKRRQICHTTCRYLQQQCTTYDS